MSNNINNTSGFVSVMTALIGNIFITIIKFIGFYVSGSGALFSESIHSFADTSNQFLLMVGIKLSNKLPNEEFVYGFGRERFLWALISACGIFFIGAGVTIFHGITALLHHEAIIINKYIFIILIISFLIESFTFWSALQELKHNHPNLSFAQAIKEGDSVIIAVIYEDGIALLGVLVALISIIITYITGQFIWDAIGSIIIGLLLGFIAILLINKNREFLLGKSIPDEIQEEIIILLQHEPLIKKVNDFKSTILDINKYRIKCEIEINGTFLIQDISQNKFFKKSFNNIKDNYPEFLEFCIDMTSRIPRLIGRNLDEIEKKITSKYPHIKHIDLEID